MIKESLNASLAPWFFRERHQPDDRAANRIFTLVYIGAGIVALDVSWFSFEMLRVLSRNPALVEGWKYSPFVVAIGGDFLSFDSQNFSLPDFQVIR